MSTRPASLRRGDAVGIVAPASPSFNPGELEKGVAALEDLGYRVVVGKSAFLKNGYLAGNDFERAKDLNAMFADERVRGVVCLRGGYGSCRVLNLLDYEQIEKTPKVFVGYSDITSLHLAIYTRTGLVTFYGPMVVTEMADHLSDYTREYFLKAFNSLEPIGSVGGVPDGPPVQVIATGVAEGKLIGGYLSAIVASIGTPYEIQTKERIFFFEEHSKEPYQVDRMLTQLLLGDKLRGAVGIAIGECVDCVSKGRFRSSFDLSEVFLDRLGGLGIPVLSGLCFGHGYHKATLPMGVSAVLNAEYGTLEIVESAVIDRTARS